MMRSGNPALNDKVFRAESTNMRTGNSAGGTIVNGTLLGSPSGEAAAGVKASKGVMTLEGTVNKTGICLLLCVGAGYLTWNNPQLAGFSMGFAIIGFVIAMVTFFKKSWAPITTPAYSLVEGAFLGGVSQMFEASYPGIVFNAVSLTFGVFAALLMAYQSRLIKATENFKLGVAAATGGIMLVYLISFVMSFFGKSMSFLHDSSPLSIGISFFVVGIAALNLVMDFDFIENASESGQAPKYMEWYGAFGLMVTLVWLYLEMLRLLAKLQNR